MPCFNDCTTSHKKRIFVLSENGKVARFNNNKEVYHNVTKFDGCVDCVGKRADYVISNDQNMQLILELKGRKIEDAADQISNTCDFLKNEKIFIEHCSALIVCSKVPLGVSSVQKVVLKLKQAGLKKIKVKSREWVGELSELCP